MPFINDANAYQSVYINQKKRQIRPETLLRTSDMLVSAVVLCTTKFLVSGGDCGFSRVSSQLWFISASAPWFWTVSVTWHHDVRSDGPIYVQKYTESVKFRRSLNRIC